MKNLLHTASQSETQLSVTQQTWCDVQPDILDSTKHREGSATGRSAWYLEGLCLSLEGFRSVGEGVSLLGSLGVHATAAGLWCRLCSLSQLGGGHALHGMALQAVADDQSTRLSCL